METVEILNPEDEHDYAILTYTAEAATRRRRKIALGAGVLIGLFILVAVLFSQLT